MNEDLLKNARIVLPEDNTEVDFMTEIFRQGVAIQIAAAKIRGIPIALFDPDKRQTYLRLSDGSRKYL